MYRFRPFRNVDPPAVADIWNSQPRQRGLMQPVSAPMLEHTVFCKPYFDRFGFIVATKETEPVGFVHAGFGPTDSGSEMTTELGVTAMLQVRPVEASGSLRADLLAQSEDYLRRRGAKVLYAGGIRPLNPFYLGLYGGSELPGVLDSDPMQQDLYRSQGYQEIDRVAIFHCDLSQFRPAVNRQQLQLRRSFEVRTTYDPGCVSWWDACTQGEQERLRFELIEKGASGPAVAQLSLWSLEPLASSWGIRVCGLTELHVNEPMRHQGLARFLIGEAFRYVFSQGVALVEVQAMAHNTPALELYKSLGFTEVDRGAVLRKQS